MIDFFKLIISDYLSLVYLFNVRLNAENLEIYTEVI